MMTIMPRRIILFSLATALLAFSIPLFGQGLSAEEQQIINLVESQTGDALKFLENVVNINSGSMNHKGVKKVGKIFGKAFNAIGFDTELIAMPKGMKRGGHLFATHKGQKGKRLLLIGHLDTVFEKDSPFQKFTKNDSVAFGPGVSDMKGGNVVILYALKALGEMGLLDDRSIIVALHGDEEKTGRPFSISRRDIIDAARVSDIALGFEGGISGTVAVARRGFTGWRLEVEGRRGHSSQIFTDRAGSGAIFESARILYEFHENIAGEQFLTFNPGTILGGTEVEFDPALSKGTVFGKSNIIAQKVIVNGGLRTISRDQLEGTKAKMRQVVANNFARTSATITFDDSYPPMAPTEGNYALAKVLDEVSRDLGLGPIEPGDPGQRGAADVSFVADLVDVIDGLGVVGRGEHSPRENVDIQSLAEATKRTAILIYRLTR